MRINRVGFLQKHVLAYVGYYPWKCGSCGSTFLYRRKGTTQKRRKSDARVEI
jgi:transposase-like protein